MTLSSVAQRTQSCAQARTGSDEPQRLCSELGTAQLDAPPSFATIAVSSSSSFLLQRCGVPSARFIERGVLAAVLAGDLTGVTLAALAGDLAAAAAWRGLRSGDLEGRLEARTAAGGMATGGLTGFKPSNSRVFLIRRVKKPVSANCQRFSPPHLRVPNQIKPAKFHFRDDRSPSLDHAESSFVSSAIDRHIAGCAGANPRATSLCTMRRTVFALLPLVASAANYMTGLDRSLRCAQRASPTCAQPRR